MKRSSSFARRSLRGHKNLQAVSEAGVKRLVVTASGDDTFAAIGCYKVTTFGTDGREWKERWFIYLPGLRVV